MLPQVQTAKRRKISLFLAGPAWRYTRSWHEGAMSGDDPHEKQNHSDVFRTVASHVEVESLKGTHWRIAVGDSGTNDH